MPSLPPDQLPKVHENTAPPRQLEIDTHYHISTLGNIEREVPIRPGCHLFYAAASLIGPTDGKIPDHRITIHSQFLNHQQDVIVVSNLGVPDKFVGVIVSTDLTSLDSKPGDSTLPMAVIPPEGTIVGQKIGPSANLDYIRGWIQQGM